MSSNNKNNDQHLELTGTVVEMCRGTFKVRVATKDGEPEKIINAKLSGKLRINKINIMPDDIVTIKVSVYDTSTGFIVRRIR
jgi:translation initiation factor IF-1